MAHRDGSDPNGSWIKLFRKIRDWRWYGDSHMVHLWLHLLTEANPVDKEWRGITIPRGSLITSLASLNQQTRISVQTLRTCLKRLISTGEITSKSTNKYSMITICNYESYQENSNNSNQQINKQTNKQLTSNQQATNKQLTTTKEYKESKKEENIKKRESERENALTPAQLAEKYISESKDENFIKWTKWTKEAVPWVYSHLRPLTEKNLKTLIAKYGKDLLYVTIQELENNKSKRKNYVGLYRTLISWCNIALKKQSK